MTNDAKPGQVASTDQLGHADETHAAPAVLDTDDIEVLREALAVAWGDLMVAQLKCNDQAGEIARLRQVWEDTRTQRDELLAHLTRKEPLPAWAVEWIRFYGA